MAPVDWGPIDWGLGIVDFGLLIWEMRPLYGSLKGAANQQ
jgi:hypothetical protein